MISIANSSFEGPAFGSGGFGSATAWAEIGSGGGAFRPVMPGLIVNSVPDGFQVGYAGNTSTPGSLFQDLGVSVVAGANYELELFVGSRNDGFTANYLVELLAGSTTVASTSGTISNTGNFIPVNLTGLGVGNGNLAIRLSETSATGQSLFDNVRLSVTAVPEPSSLLIVSTCAFGLMGYRWRRRT
jgi:hypothetical protein